MDSDVIIAEITISFTHVLDENSGYVDNIKRIIRDPHASIAINVGTNTVRVSCTTKDKDELNSKIAKIKKLDNVRGVDYESHRHVSRGFIENIKISEIRALRRGFENSPQIKVENLSDNVFKITTPNGDIQVKSDSVTINNYDITIGTLNQSGIDPSEFLKLQKSLLDELKAQSKPKKSKWWHIQTGTTITLIALKLFDWIMRHLPS